jgi:hypothetical protein
LGIPQAHACSGGLLVSDAVADSKLDDAIASVRSDLDPTFLA